MSPTARPDVYYLTRCFTTNTSAIQLLRIRWSTFPPSISAPILFRQLKRSLSAPTPMAGAPVEIYRIPTPASDADAVKYSRLRLNALRTNPEAYSSTYERDVLLSHDDWRGRVNTPGRTTVAARGCASDPEAAEWVGTLSVLHPLLLREYQDDLPHIPRLAEAVNEGRVDRYLLVGMWVHPSARKQGVGRMLIQDVVDLVRAMPPTFDESKIGPTGEEITKFKIMFLKVFADNEKARRLYRQAGFVEETECEGVVPEHLWMSMTLA